MTQFELQKLRDLPIEEVAERLGLQVSRHKALCPFHPDKHPSLSFNLRKNTYRCFVCGASGGTIDLVMHMLHKDFKAACEWLGSPLLLPQRGRDLNPDREDKSSPFWGDKRGAFTPSRYSRFFEHPYLSPEACRFLYDERHLDPRVVRWCRLNSYKDWLQIPYYNQENQLVGFQQRYLGSDPEQPRFRFGYGERASIYNLPILNRLHPDDDLYIAEGCSDCWAHLSAGHKTIAIPSATLLRDDEFRKVVSRLMQNGWKGSLHMYPDCDTPGETLYNHLLSLAVEMEVEMMRHDLPLGCKDFSDLWVLKNKK